MISALLISTACSAVLLLLLLLLSPVFLVAIRAMRDRVGDSPLHSKT
jgi:hypothetical protein